MEQKFFQFALGCLVNKLLVVCNDCFGDGLADGHYLSGLSTSSDTATQVEVLEPVSSEQKNGFVDFQPHGGWLKDVERFTVHADESLALRAVADCGGVFLSSKALDTLFILSLLHLFS